MKLLARNSSRRRPEQDRWTELALYLLPPEDVDAYPTYRVEITGRSTRPGETDRVRVEETTSPEVVVDLCAPRDKQTGVPTLTWVGRKTLLEAALLDEALSLALDDWQAVHA